MSGVLRKERKTPSARPKVVVTQAAPVTRRPIADYEADSDDGSVAYSDDEGFNEQTDVVGEQIELLTEKRAATREGALKQLRSLATSKVLFDEFTSRGQTLLSSLCRSLKRGGDQEAATAADLIAIFFVTIGAGQEGLVREAVAPLMACMRESRAGDAAGACAHALALSCFVSSDNIDTTLECLDALRAILAQPKPAPAIAIGALDGWGLLATTVSRNYVQEHFDNIVRDVRKLLSAENLEVRVAAGELLALLVELAHPRSEEQADGDEEEEEVGPAVDDELIEELHALATESSKKTGRRERADQRAHFKDIHRAVSGETGVVDRSLRFLHETVEITSWAEAAALEALTRVLGEGLHVHVAGNSTVRSILGLDEEPADEEELTSKERTERRQAAKSAMAAAAKSRARYIADQRRGKQAYQSGAFM